MYKEHSLYAVTDRPQPNGNNWWATLMAGIYGMREIPNGIYSTRWSTIKHKLVLATVNMLLNVIVTFNNVGNEIIMFFLNVQLLL